MTISDEMNMFKCVVTLRNFGWCASSLLGKNHIGLKGNYEAECISTSTVPRYVVSFEQQSS
jgi:hypothetical protein